MAKIKSLRSGGYPGAVRTRPVPCYRPSVLLQQALLPQTTALGCVRSDGEGHEAIAQSVASHAAEEQRRAAVQAEERAAALRAMEQHMVAVQADEESRGAAALSTAAPALFNASKSF